MSRSRWSSLLVSCSVLFIASIFVFHNKMLSQDDSSIQIAAFPSGTHFAPLRANIEEPRVGIFQFRNGTDSKIDIGNSIDIFGVTIPSSEMKFTLGADFMGYGYIRSMRGLRLQIDALDGVYGGNIAFSKGIHFQSRLRILHHGAHFADGHFDDQGGTWQDNRQPIPFTRNFGELTLAYTFFPHVGILRSYGGFSYALFVRPDEINRYSALGGSEFTLDKLFGPVAGEPTNLYCAYHLALEGTNNLVATNQLQCGLKWGQWYGKGMTLYLSYYSGRHIFAEYLQERLNILGAGFTVDFD